MTCNSTVEKGRAPPRPAVYSPNHESSLMSIPVLRHNSAPQRILNRRALIAFASGICVTEFLTACGEQTHDTAPARAETSDTTDGSSSPHGTESASPEAQAHPTFTKGYSGGSEAPKGEYRPADEKGPAQNVPKPKKPEDIGIETPEALMHFIDYWNALGNYATQTGDVQTYADYTAAGYKEVEKFCNHMQRLYDKGGWVVGGTRKIVADPSTLRSPSDHVYLIVGRIISNDYVILDNEQYKTFSFPASQENDNVLEFGVVFQTSNGHWSFAGTEKLDVNVK